MKTKIKWFTNQKELTDYLYECSDVYYNTGTQIIKDEIYDDLKAQLQAMEKESGKILFGSPTITVGATPHVGDRAIVKHEMEAKSLDKFRLGVEDEKVKMLKWLGEHAPYTVELKVDGSTVILTYDNGALTLAETRGDGIRGVDITDNAAFIHGVPKKIPYDGHLVVRGEAVMRFDDFEKVNTNGEYSNPRNLANGKLQSLDPNELRAFPIGFVAFELVTPGVFDGVKNGGNELTTMSERFKFIDALGFDVVPYGVYDFTDPARIMEVIETWKRNLPEVPYPTDGLVFSVQNLDSELGWKAGMNDHGPRWARAMKWPSAENAVPTTLRDVQFTEGRTGVLTPKFIFDTVNIGLGSNVQKATAFNLSILENLPSEDGEDHGGVHIGDDVFVFMANEIIPNVKMFRPGQNRVKITIPKTCPYCGKETTIRTSDSGVRELFCTNPECSAKKTESILHAVGRDGLNVKGLGESQLIDLMKYGLVHNLADLISLNDIAIDDRVNALLSQNGWGKKSYEKLTAAIQTACKVTFDKFLYALCIPMCGNNLSKKFANFFGDVETFYNSVVMDVREDHQREIFDKLSNVDGIGDKKAGALLEWARNNKAEDIADIKRLMNLFEFEDIANVEKTLSGKTFVITGKVHQYADRAEFKASVEARGGKVAGSVSKNTDYLVNNDAASESSKNKKAKELSIPIITEDEFIETFGK